MNCYQSHFNCAEVHWENNRPWASIYKNIGLTKFAKVESK